MLVTLPGMEMLVSPMHPSKVLVPIYVRPPGMEMLVNAVQFRNV